MNRRFSSIRVYDGKVFGHSVSKYGMEKGYLDYATLAKIVGDCILNNIVRAETMTDWEMISGEFDQAIYQDYIISEYGFEILADYTDEIVFYNEKLDMYIWSVTHFGTGWDYVLTDIKLVKEGE
ncbi:MAG: hypothetical protein IKZ08_02490 [Bacteroidales bacterium]|nr:hypothetical protein [Bacteroidales bacterium]